MDESQLEVNKSLVKFKTFPFIQGNEDSEKQAKQSATEWKKHQEEVTGKHFSDVGHTEQCYYVGYCLAGELAVKSVLEAGQYYKLNVDLTAGYMLGTDWASCH